MELDARVVVDLVNYNVDTNKPYSPLLCDCRCLLRRIPGVRVLHVYREGNRCTDALARWGSTMEEDFVVFSSPPSLDVLYLVNLDIASMYVIRSTEISLTACVR